jgi:hypothetical protein
VLREFPCTSSHFGTSSTTRLSDGTSNQRAVGQLIKDGRRFSSIETTLTWWQINFDAGIPALPNTSRLPLFGRRRSSIPSIAATGWSFSDAGFFPYGPSETGHRRSPYGHLGGGSLSRQRRINSRPNVESIGWLLLRRHPSLSKFWREISTSSLEAPISHPTVEAASSTGSIVGC